MTKTVTISGYIHQEGSKRGIQFLSIGGSQPFNYTAQIDVTGDPEHDDDDKLIMALSPFYGQKVAVTCDVDEDGELTATPSRFKTIDQNEYIFQV